MRVYSAIYTWKVSSHYLDIIKNYDPEISLQGISRRDIVELVLVRLETCTNMIIAALLLLANVHLKCPSIIEFKKDVELKNGNIME